MNDIALNETALAETQAEFDYVPPGLVEAIVAAWNRRASPSQIAPANPAQVTDAIDERLEKLAAWVDQSQHDKWCQDESTPIHGFSGEGILIREAIALIRELRTNPANAMVEMAMRILTRIDVAQYLLANTTYRGNGAKKAHHHDELTKTYVAVVRGCEPDRVRRRYGDDYKKVHDATALELTDRLDQVIGFDLAAHVDDDLCERFFLSFHRIAMSSLTAAIIAGGQAVALPEKPTQAMRIAYDELNNSHGLDRFVNFDLVWEKILSHLPSCSGSGGQAVAVKPLDLSTLLRDAFLSGRGLKDGDKLSDEDQAAWMKYDPERMNAYHRISSALSQPHPADDRVVEALRPFAAIADEYADDEDDDFQVWRDFDVLGATLPLRHFRKARSALAALSPTEGR